MAEPIDEIQQEKLPPPLKEKLDQIRDSYAQDGNPGDDWSTARERIVSRMLEMSPEDRGELASKVAAASANPSEEDDWETVRAQIEAQIEAQAESGLNLPHGR